MAKHPPEEEEEEEEERPELGVPLPPPLLLLLLLPHREREGLLDRSREKSRGKASPESQFTKGPLTPTPGRAMRTMYPSSSHCMPGQGEGWALVGATPPPAAAKVAVKRGEAAAAFPRASSPVQGLLEGTERWAFHTWARG